MTLPVIGRFHFRYVCTPSQVRRFFPGSVAVAHSLFIFPPLQTPRARFTRFTELDQLIEDVLPKSVIPNPVNVPNPWRGKLIAPHRTVLTCYGTICD